MEIDIIPPLVLSISETATVQQTKQFNHLHQLEEGIKNLDADTLNKLSKQEYIYDIGEQDF